jgi:hypothetical protein
VLDVVTDGAAIGASVTFFPRTRRRRSCADLGAQLREPHLRFADQTLEREELRIEYRVEARLREVT